MYLKAEVDIIADDYPPLPENIYTERKWRSEMSRGYPLTYAEPSSASAKTSRLGVRKEKKGRKREKVTGGGP
jgi:hypothetical protein